MPIEIQLREQTTIPLEVETIRPDSLQGKSVAEIQATTIFHGKDEVEFGEFFDVQGESDGLHIWNGDFSGVHWIGTGLESGSIEIRGNAGRHLGSEMTGGSITVSGDVSDWVGAEMKGGSISIAGNGGHLIGSAYRGSPKGMSGGRILIRGTVGNEVGHTMRRGLIAVGGLGDLAGFNMLAGTIMVFGNAGIRHGAGMRRGTILFLGKEKPELIPTFKYACRQNLTVASLMRNHLKQWDYPADFPEAVDLYHGDFLEGGRGEIMIAA